MKNVVFFSTLFLLVSCNSVEKYRAGIEGLATSWETTTQSVTDLSNQLNSEISGHSNMMAAIQLPDNFSKLKADVQAQVNDAMAACNNSATGYSDVLNQVSTFAAEWTTKGADLTALTEGLAAGKLGADAATKIAELTTYASDATTKVADWTSKMNEVKAATQGTHSTLIDLISGLTK
jgi:hypothetical protein